MGLVIGETILVWGTILHAEAMEDASYTYNSIIKDTDFLKLGFQVRIGKGDISIWYDKWL